MKNEAMSATAMLQIKRYIAATGLNFLMRRPPTSARRALDTLDTNTIMPFDTASGVGNDSSTEKAKEMGDIGTAKRPKRARLAPKMADYLEGRVQMIVRRKIVEAPATISTASLYLGILSSNIPQINDPVIPQLMKIPPKRELSLLL